MTQQVSQLEMLVQRFQTEPDPINRDRMVVQASTLLWWKRAHIERHPHHERFPGYCVVCRQETDHAVL